MWRLYVVSSASTRISPGSARLIARTNVVELDARSARERLLERLVPVLPEGPAAADEVLPRAALRLVDAERRRAREGRAEQRVGDPVRVEPVARLVERRPDRLEVVRLVARREADVAVRERGAERVRGRVEPPRRRPRTRASRRRARRTRAARPAGSRRGGTTRRPRARPRRSRSAPAAAPRTPRAPRSSASPARSRRAAACTGCPTTRSTRRSGASARRSSAGTGGTRRSRSSRRASTQAWWPRAASRVISVAQLGRHPARLLPVAARDADEAAVVGVVRERLDERLGRVEQPADLVVDEPLVRDAAERRELVGARVRAARRHRHALVPAEHAGRAPQVGDLGQPCAQLVERRRSRCSTRPTHDRVRAVRRRRV